MCREAFAAWIPVWGVPFSYGVAISYVLVDTGDKGIAAYREAQAELGGAAAGTGVNIGGWGGCRSSQSLSCQQGVRQLRSQRGCHLVLSVRLSSIFPVRS